MFEEPLLWQKDLAINVVLLLFFIKSAVNVSSFAKLRRGMTAGSERREKEYLRPGRYELHVVFSTFPLAMAIRRVFWHINNRHTGILKSWEIFESTAFEIAACV